MSALVHLGLANVVMATLLALVAAAVGRWAHRPALSHGLWLLVLVKLITPPLVSIPIPWRSPEPSQPVAQAEPEAPAPEVATAPQDVLVESLPVTVTILVPVGAEPPLAMRRPAFAPAAPGQGTTLAIDLEDPRRMQVYEARVITVVPPPPQQELVVGEPVPEPPVEPVTPPAAAEPWWLNALGWVWLAGACLWLARTAWHLIHFARLLRHAEPASPSLAAEAQRLALRMGLGQCPAVWLVPGRLPPMVWAGLGRPRILFPRDLLDRLTGEERESLLAHELAHVHRGDHWVRWLELVVGTLYWWLPLAWWVRQQLQAREEECCDAWVVGEMSPRAYAGAILQTLDFLAGPPTVVPLTSSALSRVDGLKRRLTLIMERRTPKQMSSLGWATVVLTATGLLPLLPQPTLPAAPPANEHSGPVKAQDLAHAGQRVEPAPGRPLQILVTRAQPTPPPVLALPLRFDIVEEADPEAADRLWQLRLRPLAVPPAEQNPPIQVVPSRIGRDEKDK